MHKHDAPAGDSGRQDCSAVHRHLAALTSRLGELEPGDITSVRRLMCGVAADASLATGVVARSAHDAPVPGTWLIPQHPDPRHRLMYCHGLGFMAGDLATHGGFASRLAAATRSSTFLVEYRLAPEHAFPAAHEDCRMALSWTQTHGPDGADAADCIVVGDSCGASLAMASALAASRQGTPSAGLILFSPFIDLSVSGASWLRNEGRDPILNADLARGCAALYAPGVEPQNRLLSPLFDDVSDLPPTQIHASMSDPAFDDAKRLLIKSDRAGVPTESHIWSDIPHVWYLFHDQLKQARHSINLTGSFVRRL